MIITLSYNHLMLGTLFTDPLSFLTWALALVIAITIHEFSHALAADKLGDPTPRSQGRLTLNPLSHLDPLGTVAILLTRFGWGRPVQFDPYNLRNPRKDSALIALAGPTSNLILAYLVSLLIKLAPSALSITFGYPIIFLNVMLAIFNLVPVYPLDGQKILSGILPKDLAREFESIMHSYGTIILIFLIWPFSGISPIASLILPIISSILSFLL